MVMPTAIGPNRMQFRQLNRIAFDEPGRLPPRLARIVSRTAALLLDRPVLRSSCEFTAADFPIWHHKQCQQPPRPASGDGPIGPFRRRAKRCCPETPGRGAVTRPHRSEGEDSAMLS